MTIRNINVPTEEPKKTVFEAHVMERHHLLVPLLKKTEDGQDAYAACVPLSQLEQKQCVAKAYHATLKDFEGKQPKVDDAGFEIWKEAYENYYGAWIVYTSFRVPDDLEKKLFPGVDQVLSYTPVEIGILHSHYLTTEYNQPAIKHVDPNNANAVSELIDLIIHQATVEETSFFLASRTSVVLAHLIRYLAQEHQRLSQIVNGSAGTLSNDTTTIS
jgi:hypothetical protein